MKFFVGIIINALALWLTTLLVPGVSITPFGNGDTLAWVLTYLLVAFIFGLVNGIIGNIIRIVAFPLYIITLGLIAIVVNALLLMLVAQISSLLGFGLSVDSFFWAGILGALVLALLSWLIGIILRPLTGTRR